MATINNWEIVEVFDDIILGRGVKRTVHDLEYDNQILTGLFIERLQFYKFRPIKLNKIDIDIGWRMPGFYVEGKTAIFGHVFWEVFTESRKRKIWGSVVRNEKGDWKYVIPGSSRKTIFVNLNQLEEVDIYYLS